MCVAGAALAPQLAGAAGVHHEALSATAGAVTARLTYDQRTVSGLPQDRNLRLTISRAGVTELGPAAPGDGRLCGPGDSSCTLHPGSLTVRDLEGNGEPDVILDLYTGGAHCCSVVQVYARDAAAGTYTLTERNFGDPGARIADLAGDGRLELASADDRFAYAFAAYAFSGLPIQIWRFAAHRFVDVTGSFPALVATDARRQYRAFRGAARQRFGLGFIAAWAADEELLGHDAKVMTTLAAQLRAGRLRSRDPRIWPGGRRFIANLRRLLRRAGYLGASARPSGGR